MIKKTMLIPIVFIIIGFLGCNTGSDKSTTDEFSIPDSLKDKPLEIAEGKLGEIVKNISSPVEIAMLLKEAGATYSQSYLSDLKDIESYDNAFKCALNLGVVGTDLGYMNIYEKTMATVNYLSAIKTLSNKLSLEQFFDFAAMKRMAENKSNLDSMAFISVQNFNNMDSYLREHKRSNVSAMIVTGLWVESMYIAIQVNKDKPNKKIVERIGEQKIIVGQLLLILKNFKSDNNIALLTKDIEAINNLFNNVKITIEYGEPESVEKDGMLTIVQHEISHIEMSKDQFNQITKLIVDLRNKITKKQ